MTASPWWVGQKKHAKLLLDFVRERGEVHPREVGRAFCTRPGDELLGRLVKRDTSFLMPCITPAFCVSRVVRKAFAFTRFTSTLQFPKAQLNAGRESMR